MEFERNTVVYPPNKNLERRIDFSQTPLIYNNLMFLDFNSKGESILGASSVNKTLWEGTSLYFKDEAALLSLTYDKSYIGSTVSDGKFLDDDTIVLAEDTGILNVLSTSHDKNAMHSITYYRHLDRIPKLAVWKNSSHVLTGSGCSIVVWDVNSTNRKPLQFFENYHAGLVTYVDTFKNDRNLFVSTSLDRFCCIWDDRSDNPASVLFRHNFSALTSVACNEQNTNYVVIGTEGGEIYLLDRREPKDFMSRVYTSYESYRLVFNDHYNLAMCSNTPRISVFNCEDESLIHLDDKHNDVVRGLAWYNDSLYSCGCDKQVIKHTLP